ncbi:nicotinate-nucleotide--dimethylbenzimidazole phosphoribosyltransferase [Immundisolibacter sp.]|uniref:nicotinate-nucleotide--dimethylbenzimidazole phosphoribosyltransferase n=1 Tax=Immundisolibacter sp. TaxID=1934948 RepID=UPI003F829EC7
MNDWLHAPCAVPDAGAAARAAAHQARLTKPAGALGRLESLAVQLAAWQGTDRPSLQRVRACVFAADHGVAAHGVSAYPQAVTAQMVANFLSGGAAASVLAREQGVALEVVNLGTVGPVAEHPGLVNRPIAAMTHDFTTTAAMSGAQRDTALQAGRDAVRRAADTGAQMFIAGEMGIGNTTAAAALAGALLRLPATRLTGPGTGLAPDGIRHKTRIIERALALHGAHCTDPLEALRRLGGFEIAAIAGAALACAQTGLPLLVDGFITTAAVLAACRLQPAVRDWCLFAHASAEPGHQALLQALDAEPLLALGLRLGEGSGALTALPLLRLACATHGAMATFESAKVRERLP